MNATTEFEIGRVLCGVDFSELSDLALKYAAAGAKAYGAELTVFHAEYFDLPTYTSGGGAVVRGASERA